MNGFSSHVTHFPFVGVYLIVSHREKHRWRVFESSGAYKNVRMWEKGCKERLGQVAHGGHSYHVCFISCYYDYQI